MNPLPADTRPGMVRLRVADLGRSLAWYHDLLGFAVLDSDGPHIRLGAGNEAFLELVERPGARPAARRAPSLYHFAVLLPDRAGLGAVLAKLIEADVRVGSADHLVSEALYITDPDGLGIELYADRPREQWPWRHGRILMDILPLDLRSLLRDASSGGGGLPVGTRIGHMHLHVPDLEVASGFYTDQLGLERMFAMPSALFLAAGGYHHHLGLNTWATPGSPAAEDEAALLEWELIVPGGAELGVGTVPAGGELRLEDPFGMALTLRG